MKTQQLRQIQSPLIKQFIYVSKHFISAKEDNTMRIWKQAQDCRGTKEQQERTSIGMLAPLRRLLQCSSQSSKSL